MTKGGKIITSIALILVLGAVITFISLFCVEKFSAGNIELEAHPITIEYGEDPDISFFKIEIKSAIMHKVISVEPTLDMLVYNAEIIGEQNAKFTYKNESIDFILTITPHKLETPIINYNNGKIEWNIIEGSTSYLISINGAEYETLNNYHYVEESACQPGDVEVKVKAISNDLHYSTSEYSQVVTLDKLEITKNILYENSTLKWDPVLGATSYKVFINGNEYTASTNSLKIESSKFKVGENVIEVQTVGSSLNINSDKATSKIIKYKSVEGIKYIDGKLNWTSSISNCKFEIYINQEKYTSTIPSLDVNLDYNVSYDVKIKVISLDNQHIDSDFSSVVNIVLNKLDTPVIKYNNGKIEWNIVEDSTSYVICLNGIEHEISNNYYYIKDFTCKPGEIIVKVKAVSSDSRYNASDYSKEIKLNKLEKTKNILYENSTLKWDPVLGVNSYKILINGNEYTASTNSLKIESSKFKVGKNIIEVQTVGSSLNISSDKATSKIIKYKSVEGIKYIDGKLNWTSSISNCKFEIYINQEKYTSTIPSLDVNLDYNVSYDVKIKVISLDNQHIDSDFSSVVNIVLNKLDTPVIKYNNGKIEWNIVEDSTNYVICLNGIEHEISNNYYYIKDFTCKPGDIIVKVKAVSSDFRYNASDYSKEIKLNKLEITKNILYENSTLKWDPVLGATSYKVFINGNEYTASTNSLKIESSKFKVGENTIEVQTVGSSLNINSDKAISKIIKYKSVEDIKYIDGKLNWTSSILNCKFEIYINEEKYSSTIPSLDVTLDYNVSYDVKIKVISLDNQHIDSDFSSVVNIVLNKLEQPNLSIKLGSNSNSYDIILKGVPNADKYKLVVKIYKGSSLYLSYDFELTSNLKRTISVEEGVTKIEVECIAIDSSNKFEQSDVVKVSRTINQK